MKTKILTIALIISLFVFGKVNSQTAGNLSVLFSQPIPTSPSGTKNVLAVWIETSTGTFVKTRMRFWGSNTTDHLPTWKAKSNQNLVDAITGATLTSSTSPTAFGNKTVIWDGKDINGNIVADGDYKVWVESSWQTSLSSNTHNDIISFTFSKTGSSFSKNYSGDTYFNSVTIGWTPGTTSSPEIELQKNIIYPNPTTDNIFVDLKTVHENCSLEIYDILGNKILTKKYSKTGFVDKISMKSFIDGIYYIHITIGNNSETYPIILKK